MTDLNDIRKYFTPPRSGSTTQRRTPPTNTPDQNTPMQRNWKGRRRIVESDSDDNAVAEPKHQGEAVNTHDDTAAGKTNAIAEPITIESSDDNDIWVRPLATQEDLQTMEDHGVRQVRGPPHAHVMVPATAQLGRRRSTRLQAPPIPCSRRRRFEGEAEESTTNNTESFSSDDYCDESETDAEDLYRSAIAGVRNARVARQQLRTAIQHCPVCAKFAAFLQHFL
jgi:hypothetical protein